jgi:hypothetical protein
MGFSQLMLDNSDVLRRLAKKAGTRYFSGIADSGFNSL